LSLFQYCIALEEFSRLHRAFTIAANYSSGMTPMAISRHGTVGQKETFLRGFAAGKLKSAFALTEPEAGSDAAGMRTRAEKTGDGWVLNGRKHYISGGHVADVIMVMAVTDPEKRARGGITAFLVERGTPGFSVTRVDTTIATDSIKLAELTFENCRLPADSVIGEVGAGFKVAMGSLNDGRMSVSCSCVGAAESLLDRSIARRFSGCSPTRRSISLRRARYATTYCAGSKKARTSVRPAACASCSPPKWSGASPTAQCRSTAAWA
jgi:acyl-CoA dehydrogenase